MKEREVYPNAPLVLVALEVRHPTASSLSPAQRRAIKERLGDHVPIMRSGQLRVTMVQGGGSQSASSELHTEEFPRYFSRDSTVSVSMRAEATVIETTRYGGWGKLRSLIADTLAARQDIGEVDGFERVGIRYVNEIRVPDDHRHGWAGWVDPSVLGSGPVGSKIGLAATQWHGVNVFTAGEDRLVVLRYGSRHGFAVSPGGDLKRTTPTPGPFFLLDIDSFWTPSKAVPEFDVKVLMTTCDELHEPVGTLFEQLITERLREEVLRRAG